VKGSMTDITVKARAPADAQYRGVPSI